MNTPQPIKQDEVFQIYILKLVSRTFALTIPVTKTLENHLNAYLLCRIADTIEDDPNLSFKEKHFYSKWFSNLVKKYAPDNKFADELTPKLGNTITNAEKELIKKLLSEISKITHSLTESKDLAMHECVEAMTIGMVKYQGKETLKGLNDQEELDLYCYYVAGVVGVMLTVISRIWPRMDLQLDKVWRH